MYEFVFSLPKTAYMKMIDIWAITAMSIPFFEVVLHTTIDVLIRHKHEALEKSGILKWNASQQNQINFQSTYMFTFIHADILKDPKLLLEGSKLKISPASITEYNIYMNVKRLARYIA